MSEADSLSGRRVLVTRPAERAGGLIAAIEAAGGRPVALPTLVLAAAKPSADAIAAARTADFILFTSPASVAHGLELLGLTAGTGAQIGAVGPATAAALRQRGLPPEIEPIGAADSEGLLRAPQLAPERVQGRQIVIVRGGPGRATLPGELMARGAAVHYADVYRRERPQAPTAGTASACDILTATSNEGLTNLLAMLEPREVDIVRAKPLAVSSARTAELARAQGFRHEPQIADQAGDPGLLAAIRRCASRLSSNRAQPDASEPRSENT
ncbi:MAG: uroporphyrinogen-III synthase [Halofilum sp. (in: g-proteobacteria)]